MWKVAVFLAQGFEETEAIGVIDLLRRGGADVSLWGCGPGRPASASAVTSARGITVQVDGDIASFDLNHDLVFLPGGNPGTPNLGADVRLPMICRRQAASHQWLAAICAAPTLLAQWGLLAGKRACCFPGLEEKMTGVAEISKEPVVVDGKIVTSRGMGTTLDLGLALVSLMSGPEVAAKLSDTIVYRKA